MGKAQSVKKEIREELLKKVREGISVKDAAELYGVSTAVVCPQGIDFIGRASARRIIPCSIVKCCFSVRYNRCPAEKVLTC